MRYQWDFFLRFCLGVIFGTIAAFFILQLGDRSAEIGLPSFIEQPPSTWIYIFPWLLAAGAAIGFVAGLSTLWAFQKYDPNRIALTIIPFAMLLVGAVETLLTGTALTITDLLVGAVLRGCILLLFSFVGILVAMLLGLSVARVISVPRRSGMDVAPDELKEQWQRDRLAQPPVESLSAKILHFFHR